MSLTDRSPIIMVRMAWLLAGFSLGLSCCFVSELSAQQAGYTGGSRAGGPPHANTHRYPSPASPRTAGQSNAAHRPTGGAGPSAQRSVPTNTQRPAPDSSRPTRFPYVVRTTAAATPIRSGPSSQYYHTDRVPAGTSLEVWRHDPDGWLAIRPPAGSFSLIRAEDVRPTDSPEVYQVVTDRAKVWVGTLIDEDHLPVPQVRLSAGEQVAMISSLVIEEEGKSQSWLQIEAPAGEFRWVHSGDLQAGSASASVIGEPRTGTRAPSRDQWPADAPFSGYMPNVNSTLSGARASHDSTTMEIPHLEFDSGVDRSGRHELGRQTQQGWAGSDSAQWRAAQQTEPQLSFVDPDASILAGHPRDNPLAGPAQSSAAWTADSGALVQQVSNQSTSAGEMWDQAVQRLRMDPMAVSLAERDRAAQPTNHSPPTGSGSSAAAAGAAAGIVQPANFQELDWNQRLAWVQSQLGSQTSLPSQQWNLWPLLEHCRTLWQSAPSQPQREAAGELGKRIEELLRLQQQRPTANDLTAGGTTPDQSIWSEQRFASLGSPILSGGASGSSSGDLGNTNPFLLPPGAGPPTTLAADPGLSNAENPFDAVGYLKELIIARGQHGSQYVLQDSTGRSLCHLTAQPGVNLQPFLDQKVGVNGIKGYHSKFNLPHVSVERIFRIP